MQAMTRELSGLEASFSLTPKSHNTRTDADLRITWPHLQMTEKQRIVLGKKIIAAMVWDVRHIVFKGNLAKLFINNTDSVFTSYVKKEDHAEAD